MKFPTEKHLEEFTKDKFGYSNISKKILDDILLEMELPNCFGLYGNWGSGKSTLISYLKKYLKEEPKYKKIISTTFEPWKYEYSEQKDLLYALLNCIKKEGGISSKKWKRVLTDAAVISSGLLRYAKLVDLHNVSKDFNIFEKKIYDEHEKWIDKVEEFKRKFNQIIIDVLKKKKASKLIVFIDDLDRCLPENSVKLLEGIKNLLSVENTLFVIAVDRRIVSEMIQKKYGLHNGYGDEYLMKIIHYYYELPNVDLSDVVTDLLNMHLIKCNEMQKNYIVAFLKNQASEPRIAKHVLHQFGMSIALSKKAQKEISEDNTGTSLQYFFVASFLLIKFKNLFSTGEPAFLLSGLIQYANLQPSSSYSNELQRITENIGSLDPEKRDKLKDIISRHPIKTGTEASAPSTINDAWKLSRAIQDLRNNT
jgi:nucleoside-triphosphatase THEP1